MDDPRSVIERGLARAGSESYTLESFYRRRDRKRARTRFTAGVVGLAIAIVIAVVGSAILRSAPEDKDVGGKGPRILRDGEVLQVVDQFGDSATFVATDLETGTQRLLHRCAVPSGDPDCGYIEEFGLSAEGGWIAWEQGCTGGGTESCTSGLWVADADGPPVQVTSSGGTDSPGWIWAWSPATEQLAFATGRSGSAELVLLRSGNRRTNERHDGRRDLCSVVVAGWHRDRDRVAVLRACPSSISQPGVRPRSARVGAVEDGDLSWSPDGTRLVLDATDGTDHRRQR